MSKKLYCYMETAEEWKAEYDRIFDKCKLHLSDYSKHMQRAYLLTLDQMRKEAFRSYGASVGDTFRLIPSEWVPVDLRNWIS